MRILTQNKFEEFSEIINQGLRKTYAIELSNGFNLIATVDHKFLTKQNEWLELQHLALDEELVNGAKVISIQAHDIENVYDVVEVKNTNSYWANSTIVHNCDLMYADECLTGSMKVTLLDGTTRPIADIDVGDYLLTYCEKTNKFVSNKVSATKMTGIKEVFEYKTVSGNKLIATPNHPVLTDTGWMEISKATNMATTKTRVGRYFFESIISVEARGQCKVYNITVENTHTFIANGFITHNCDFLSSRDLNSLLAIVNDNPDVNIWMSSTPIGEGNLYKLCTDPSFKEFHFPTYVVPHYSDELDNDNLRRLTDVGYSQEILANFDSADDTVFQLKFIDQAVYSDEALKLQNSFLTWDDIAANRSNFIIAMGVDWNREKVGTRIVVIAYDKTSARYHIIGRDTVTVLGWTQTEAIKTIIKNNERFDVEHLYVDDGHGETQHSLLRLYGQERLREVGINHPDARLIDTKAVMFGSNIVFRDPVTNEEIKKQTKQYMVEHTANLLARGNLILRKESDSDIIMQFKNYIVKSVTSRGVKVFKARDSRIGDHDLDAYMLALHAIHQEYPSLIGNSPLTNLISSFGTPNISNESTGDISGGIIVNRMLGNRPNSSRFIHRKRL